MYRSRPLRLMFGDIVFETPDVAAVRTLTCARIVDSIFAIGTKIGPPDVTFTQGLLLNG
jgi:hypothetical protein